MSKGLVKEKGSSCIISVDVVPDAPRTELGKFNEWRGALQIKLAAHAREGEANEELTRFLAEMLGIPRESVQIVKGETSRHKSLLIHARKERVERLLGVEGC